MGFNIVLFDLDGTLTDPAIGITNSVTYALKKMGITPPERKELFKFIGPPLAESFEKYYSLSKEQAYKAVDIYREYFAPKGIYENTVYDGVPEMLKSLKNAGKTIALATSKPIVFANKILKHFGLNEFFDLTVGSNLDGTLTNKAEVVAVVLEKLGNPDPKTAVMVGDRFHDIIGGAKNNLKTVGVTFGYGSEDELLKAGASRLARSVDELENFLLG